MGSFHNLSGITLTKTQKRHMDRAVDFATNVYMDSETPEHDGVASLAVEEYVKLNAPLVLHTVEELEELPRHSIISYGTDGNLYIYVRLTNGWYFGGADARPQTSEKLVNDGRGPFTVIQRGPDPDDV